MSRLEDAIQERKIEDSSFNGKVLVAFPDGKIHSCDVWEPNKTAYSDCGYSYDVRTKSIAPDESQYTYCQCVIETISPWKETKNSTK
jgi:hypothetical protein